MSDKLSFLYSAELWIVLFVSSAMYKAATVDWPIDVTALAAVVVVIHCGAIIFKSRKLPNTVYVLYIIWLTIIFSSLWTVWTDYAVSKVTVAYSQAILAAFAGAIIARSNDSVRNISLAIVLLSCVIAIFMIRDLLLGNYGWRVQSFGISSIALGRGFGLSMVIILFYYKYVNGRGAKILSVVAFALCMVSLISSGNRQGLMGFVIAATTGIAVSMYLGHMKSSARAYLLLALAAVAIFAVANILPDNAIDRYDTLALETIDTSTEIRLGLVEHAMNGINDSPILGHGIGSFASLGLGHSERPIYEPHNLFLELWYESGILSLVVVLVAIAYAMRRLLKFAKLGDEYSILLIQMLVFIVSISFVGGIYDKLFWMVLSLSMTWKIVHWSKERKFITRHRLR